MHLDPTQPQTIAWIADHLSCASEDLTAEDIETVIHDESLACTCCGGLYSSRFDFADLDRDNGILICHECENTEEADDLRRPFDWREVA